MTHGVHRSSQNVIMPQTCDFSRTAKAGNSKYTTIDTLSFDGGDSNKSFISKVTTPISNGIASVWGVFRSIISALTCNMVFGDSKPAAANIDSKDAVKKLKKMFDNFNLAKDPKKLDNAAAAKAVSVFGALKPAQQAEYFAKANDLNKNKPNIEKDAKKSLMQGFCESLSEKDLKAFRGELTTAIKGNKKLEDLGAKGIVADFGSYADKPQVTTAVKKWSKDAVSNAPASLASDANPKVVPELRGFAGFLMSTESKGPASNAKAYNALSDEAKAALITHYKREAVCAARDLKQKPRHADDEHYVITSLEELKAVKNPLKDGDADDVAKHGKLVAAVTAAGFLKEGSAGLGERLARANGIMLIIPHEHTEPVVVQPNYFTAVRKTIKDAITMNLGSAE